MAATEAQIRANRQNSQRSTGPKSPEGKARVRGNALKHGLTGKGVALPTEDQDEITRSFTALQDELKPSNELSEKLLRRVSFLFVRVERCEKHETRETAKRVRHAIAKFDDERLAAVEVLGTQLYSLPATTSRRLQMTPEGIDWLLDELETLRGDLTNTLRDCWTQNHRSHFDALLGRNPGGYRVARFFALSDAMAGYFQYLEPSDGEGLEGQARSEWARGELTRLMDVEIERLRLARVSLDPEALAEDRAEAVDRALVDTSHEVLLARRYEAATERALFRTLKEFHQAEADAAEGRQSNITVDKNETYDPLALNCRDDDEDATEDDPEPSPTLPMVPPALFSTMEPATEGPIPVGTVPVDPS